MSIRMVAIFAVEWAVAFVVILIVNPFDGIDITLPSLPRFYATTYTAAEMLAIIAAVGAGLVAVLTAVGNMIVAIRTSQKLDENTKVTTEGLREVSAKADVISGHVNSQASTSKAEIDGLRAQVATMHEMLSRSDRQAAVLAAAAIPPVNIQPQIEAIAADVATNKAAIEDMKHTEPKP